MYLTFPFPAGDRHNEGAMDVLAWLAWVGEPGRIPGREYIVFIGPLIALGIGTFAYGLYRESQGGSGVIKYLSFLPLIGCAVMGWPYFRYATDPFSRQAREIGDQTFATYYAGFLVPIGLIVIMAIWILVASLRSRGESDL